MATSAQLAANAANAQHSTVPRTAEGKARSAQNSRTHGLTAAHLVIGPGEQPIFEEMSAALRGEIKPEGELESLSFDQLLHAAWNLHRLRLREAEMAQGGLDPLLDPAQHHTLSLLLRYRNSTQRDYNRSLAELRKLQENRAFRMLNSVPDVAALIPGLAPLDKVTKRTQIERWALELFFHFYDIDPQALHQDILKKRREDAKILNSLEATR